MEHKIEKLPPSALSLYVTLYCKRKGDTHTKYHNNLTEATKSWLLLSEHEKQQFAIKLKECRIKYKNRFADYLKNTEPYLQKKPTRRQSVENIPSTNETDTLKETLNVQNNESNQIGSPNQLMYDDTKTETELQESFCTSMQCVNNNSILKEEIENEPYELVAPEPLPEPTPPTIKSGKELFDIIKSTDEDHERTWQSLSTSEKRRYQMTVLYLKKDYISKYKSYLESLSSKELFEYYNRKI